jgi:hypothetical protein
MLDKTVFGDKLHRAGASAREVGLAEVLAQVFKLNMESLE